MTKSALVLLIIAIALVGLVFSKRQTPNPPLLMVVLESPMPNQRIASPLIVTGRARGNWFFEASFPVKLLDAQGVALGTTIAQAQEEWMTTEFVPFRAELTFTAPSATDALLILEKDNPSGMPEHADAVRLPVRVGPDTMSLQVYFTTKRTGTEPNFDCTEVTSIARYVPKTQTPGRAALDELLKGPTPGERDLGYGTNIPEGVVIQRLTIGSGTAAVDFNAKLEEGVGGSCRVAAIRAQIMNTLKQFPTVQRVTISIDGRTEDILQP